MRKVFRNEKLASFLPVFARLPTPQGAIRHESWGKGSGSVVKANAHPQCLNCCNSILTGESRAFDRDDGGTRRDGV